MAEPSAGTTQGGGGLFGKWMEELLKKGGSPPTNPQEITEEMQKSLKETWENLKKWVTRKNESKEIKNFCENITGPGGTRKGLVVGAMKEMCKAVAEIRYFMSGIGTEGSEFEGGEDVPPTYEAVGGPEAYRRCLVGAVALSEIYGDHCHLKDVINHISQSVEDKLKAHDGAIDNLDACKGITANDLIVGKAVLGDTIKEWEQRMKELMRAPGWGGISWRLLKPWMSWSSACGGGKQGKGKETEEKNKGSIGDFLNVGDTNNRAQLMDELISDKESLTIGDLKTAIMSSMQNDGTGTPLNFATLMSKVEEKIQKNEAEACMKQDGMSSCERLKCAKTHWELTKQQSSSGVSWDEHVQNELGNLFNRGTTSSSTTPNQCENDGLDNANKEACKHITAKLELMYRTASGKHQLSDQIINCLLLNVYAKKLKEEAQKKGLCNIDDGLKKAFEQSSTIMTTAGQCTNGTNDCFVCTQNENYDSCLNDSTGIKQKVDDTIKEKNAQIQRTLTDINKVNSLCERIQCAAKWYENNGGPGKGQNQFWTDDVKKLWEELAQKMTASKGTGNGDCNIVDKGTNDERDATDPEKTACKFLHAGLTHLYTTTAPAATAAPSGTSNPILDNPSLRQAMGCFLLHLYAKHMKEKAICNIEKGISTAFTLWKDPNSKANSCQNGKGKGQCVPCQWNESKYDNCKIEMNGKTDSKVEKKLDGIVTKDDAAVTAAAKEMNEVKDLCKRFQCVSERWLKQEKANKGGTVEPSDWKKVWDAAKNELTTLGKDINSKKKEVHEYCKDLGSHGDGRPRDKEACLRIAAGLKNLYDIKDGNEVEKSFKRTMQCVLLNAVADRLMGLRCKGERSVVEGITKAFDNSESIKDKSVNCKGDKCFKCERFKEYSRCYIKENSNTSEVTKLHDKIDPMLEDSNISSSLSKSSLTRTICGGQCKDTKGLCGRVECVKKQWLEDRGHDKSNKTKENEMWTEVQKEVTKLDSALSDNGGSDGDVDSLCSAVTCTNGAKDCVSKTTCKLIVRALKDIHQIKKEDGSGSEGAKLNDRIFKSTMRCVILNALAEKLKQHAKQGGYACAVEEGIKGAFVAAGKEENRKKWCKENGKKDDGSCEECKEQKCISSTIENKNLLDEVMKKLNDGTTNTNIQFTLSEIKRKVTLCDRLQCLASRVQLTMGNNRADDFWGKEGGEVAKLWKELSQAMTDNGGQDKGGQCGTMDDGSGAANGRPATDPEKKACNYLHAGFEQLKTTPTNGTSTYPILSKDPLLRQTVGCLLLKEYAKKMQDQSKCVIDSGLKKAFKTWNTGITTGECKNGSSCIECEWEENLETCEISTNGKTGKTKVTQNLKTVLPDNDTTVTAALTKINHMDKLCDYIKCAAPKWFQNNATTSNGKTTPKKTWCDFWDTTVKGELLNMFTIIQTNGNNTAKNNNVVCKAFGDGNADSVERKACNHITAGLQHINTITGDTTTQNGNKDDDKFFKQSMMCAALNLYATKIRKEMENICPIDEERIKAMFDDWNNENNKNSSSSSSPSCSSGVYGCFKCERVPKSEFSSCQLSVDSSLVKTKQNGQNCEENKEKVPQKMDELLKKESQMKQTLDKINEMDKNFCTQLQCAAKLYYVEVKNKKGQSSGVNWDALSGEIGRELKELLEYMTKSENQNAVTQYCQDYDWYTLGHKQSKTNKAACLLFAAGLQHIYTHGNDQKKGPSFRQTMGCLFLKEYAKQLKVMADKEKKYKVHPDCSVKEGIEYAFKKSGDIMKGTPPCNKNGSNTSCFECKLNDYNDCLIGTDNVKSEVESIFQDQPNKNHMQQTLENTVCPILLTDILTPFLPLAPVSIGLSAMAYYLWKYFGPLGKGGPRFRRSPAQASRPSVQEQLLDHVQPDSSHEYQLVKERKPRSAPTRTKRSGRVNRRTIIEIHFEVLDECQKGDTQLNQKDFLELLVREFMGSELMEEEQVPKEEVLMEGVPMESVPMERVPSLGSVFMV
ncbi:SICAvar, type I [Plasmodium knowlesi strain H]|uniref:SICAvar, type I n=3 Tax=Plasmodium knowlesi TaxID=5850 RepID=A0A5K1VJH9_PLAKH|nr:SICAvar, type I [Plasmodium knowlesi strain H]OTN67042.1 SICAvar type I [Plasmodium knowlesi]CAA9988686.1 SICAvar, type I [Plasmodium knowlesi strain H]SBO21602.1 SICAvar, type I [Plasmodium knowlesi strain H]SBO21975.1 SICAvar, type I [Plasmodium knowlesi strain H]VVS78160.1 SICAvar, type I [Plasmodium knowlesi strain H]|eukprot:XP_002259663.1 SICA antigen [Plasmodium knowlesi strain H]